MIVKYFLYTLLKGIIVFISCYFIANAEKSTINSLLTLPEDFPPIVIDSNTNPSPGVIFLSTADIVMNQGINPKSKYGAYFMKIDNEGNPISYKKVNLASADYKMHPNGLESYGNSINPKYVLALEVDHHILDKNMNVIDTVQCGNGFTADFHEFHILPNGHYLLIAWEEIMMDLSKIFPNASPSARVIGTIFQELDSKKNVVFQWRSLDHLSLSELAPYVLQANTFDQARGNSGFPDLDGNYIFSFPSTHEIMKVNRTTGDVMWRLGGIHNEFTFINEHIENAPKYFTWQHYAHRLPNGNLLIFDNGIFRNPPFSRAVEYKLDEVNKTCELVWEYRHDPDIITSFGGGAQRLSNGNTLITWGMVGSKLVKTATEVTPNKEIVFEVTLPKELIVYRSYRFDTTMCDKVAKVDVNEVLEGNTYKFNKGKDTTAVVMTFERMEGFMYNTFTLKKFDCPPVDISFEGVTPWIYPMRYEFTGEWVNSFKANVKVNTKLLSKIVKPDEAKIYFRSTLGEGKFVLVPTEYDTDTKELLFDAYSFGEYIIGVPYPEQPALLPHHVYPLDQAKVDVTKPINLKWSLLGYATSSSVQVSKDNNFIEIVAESYDLQTTLKNVENLETGTTYYWRVKSKNEFGESSSTEPWSFTPMEPFISMVIPNGGEEFYKDSIKSIIRWDKNTNDSVRIELYRNGQFNSIIRDSLYTTTNAFAWSIPKSIVDDSTYQIKVFSISDNSFFAESEGFFTITIPTGVIDNFESQINFQCYPNPMNEFAQFAFSSPCHDRAVLNIFDMNGQLVANVFDDILEEGKYIINWNPSNLASGVYSARLMINSRFIVTSISILK